MRVAVLGAGVVGVTTAYYLAEKGCQVTVFDRAGAVAAETSHANGAQLSYSYTDAMARPAFVPTIPGLVLGADPGVRVSFRHNLSLLPWGLRFLAQCTSARARDNTLAVLRMSLRSAQLMARLQDELGLAFSHRRAGKLVLLGDGQGLAAARERAALKRQLGCETQVLSPEQALAREPALAALETPFAGAVYSESDEVGDPRVFSNALAQWLQVQRGVELRMGEEVTALRCQGGRLDAVQTRSGEHRFDACVVCLGPWSGTLLRPLGINPAICPVRGYSVTLPAVSRSPMVSVTSLRHRMVFSRLGEAVRIAGFADFVGMNTGADDQRARMLLDTARRIAPAAADYGAVDQQPWGGFRAMTPSGRPRVGSTRVPGLFVNVGHGMLGWTLACATGHDVAEAVWAGDNVARRRSTT